MEATAGVQRSLVVVALNTSFFGVQSQKQTPCIYQQPPSLLPWLLSETATRKVLLAGRVYYLSLIFAWKQI